MRIALITGASSGLGSSFVIQLDKTEKNLDEIWLVARRKERMEKLSKKLSHKTRIIPLDLTDTTSIDKLNEMLTDDIRIGLLINCAGYGKIGNYSQVSRHDVENMIDLNCKAAVNITNISIRHMKAGDRIMEICSMASFQPVSQLNVYASTKAFLYSYTRALRVELQPKGIVVTAVCPWWVKDTEFIGKARVNGTDKNNGNDRAGKSDEHVKSSKDNNVKRSSSGIRSFPLASKCNKVVKKALRTSRMGLAVSTPGIMCSLHRMVSKFLPRNILLYAWEIMRRV